MNKSLSLSYIFEKFLKEFFQVSLSILYYNALNLFKMFVND
jgi:hypothetical protein